MGCRWLEGEAGLNTGKKRSGDTEEICIKGIFTNFYSSLKIINKSYRKLCDGK